MYKIYLKNNYLFIENTVTGLSIEGLAHDVLVVKLNTDSLTYYFKNMNSSSEIKNGIALTDIVDENDNPYTEVEWIDFYTTNTGFSKAGSAIVPSGNDEEFLPTAGTNLITLTQTPITTNFLLTVYRNGVLQFSTDYILVGAALTFTTPFLAFDEVIVRYRIN